jgi:hypothetical protein
MHYLSGVTADEVAYVVCEFFNFILYFSSCLNLLIIIITHITTKASYPIAK